ncbi:hypothetical protein [Bradyrhizobium sp. RT5a]|uniref:hypothetical protein n=1 Tax=unclassified Bradyrhizobium TaxID=2631580 RepID=UPI003399D9A5
MGDHDGLESVITIGWNTHMRARESCEIIRHERNIHEGLAFTGENLFSPSLL